MLIAGFPAGSFATNCYVVAPGPGEECIIIDPGQDAEPGVTELLAEYRLRPVAVLATHGHVDHIWSVAPVCGAQGIPAYIHPADRALLSDPAKGFRLQVGQQLFRGLTFTEPDDVIALADGMTLRLAGVELGGGPRARPHARLGDVPDRQSGGFRGSSPRASTVLFSGDLLFAGSIGRTDLPGGDYPTILDSLSRVCLTLPDDTLVLPGTRAADDHRRRARHQPVPGRALSRAGAAAAPRPGAGHRAEEAGPVTKEADHAMIRSHEAGTLRRDQAGERVTLAGWVARRRDHGGVVFIDLRDASGVVQVVFRGEGEDRPEHALRAEFCIRVTGEVRERPPGNENPDLPTGQIEVVADDLEVLGESEPLPFPVEGSRGAERGCPAALPLPGHPAGRDGRRAAPPLGGVLPGRRCHARARLRLRGDAVPDPVHAGRRT